MSGSWRSGCRRPTSRTWADHYRAIDPAIALPLIAVLPGAHDALAAARERGRTILITAKNTPSAQLHVDHLRLAIDEVFGRAWRKGKATVLREQGATTYVGDHVHDMEAAKLSGAVGVGVSTGPSSVDELREAGAAHVLASLEDSPAWITATPPQGTLDVDGVNEELSADSFEAS